MTMMVQLIISLGEWSYTQASKCGYWENNRSKVNTVLLWGVFIAREVMMKFVMWNCSYDVSLFAGADGQS